MKRLGLLVIACCVSSCATMSPKECKSANWRDIGYSDASKGEPVLLSGHRKACKEVKITPNRDQYMSGYRVGAKEFCTYDNGLRFGKKGSSAENLCTTATLGRGFFKGYAKGKKIYKIKSKISDKESAISKIDKKLKKISKGKVKSSVGEVDLLYREKELINREIRSLESDIERIE